MYSHALQAAEEGEYGGEEQYEDYGQYEEEGYAMMASTGAEGNKGKPLILSFSTCCSIVSLSVSGKKQRVGNYLCHSH